MLFFQIVLIVLFPALAIWLTRRFRVAEVLSPVVLCYAVGIVIASFGLFPVDEDISHRFAEVTVLFAIPLLLYSTDLKTWLRSAPSTLLSFGAIVLIVFGVTLCAGLLGREYLPDSGTVSAMLTGLYIGGSPDMNAVGLALDAPSELFVYLNIADIVVGGIFLLFLTSLAPGFFGKFLPAYRFEETTPSDEQSEATREFYWKDATGGLLLSVFVVALSAGLTYLFTSELKNIGLIVLLLTSFALGLSLVRDIRTLRGTFDLGEYLLLMFCVAIGLLADFTEAGAASVRYILYTGVVLVVAVTLHTFAARLLRIDRDTFLITLVAALYGPVFIGQIASVLHNRQIVLAGIGTSLVGYALGNYLGLLVAAIL